MYADQTFLAMNGVSWEATDKMPVGERNFTRDLIKASKEKK